VSRQCLVRRTQPEATKFKKNVTDLKSSGSSLATIGDVLFSPAASQSAAPAPRC